MSAYAQCLDKIAKEPRVWLVTGAAGFIGSNLVETLLRSNQIVKGLDNYSTGKKENLVMLKNKLSEDCWSRFTMVEGDIRDFSTCKKLSSGVDHILHQAALGSVSRSIEDPIITNANNIDGFLNILVAAKDAGATFVYAASSSTYGDEPNLPKVEDRIGNPLSPYAVTKYVNELYAQVFASAYGYKSIGLRYFNIFGQRQDPEGAYAAVIPQWFAGAMQNKSIYINGDGETSRDFCYIDNCVQANILASCAENDEAWGQVYNIALGERTTLNELFELIKKEVVKIKPEAENIKPEYRDFRAGDVRHSLADIDKAKNLLGYNPKIKIKEGLELACQWYAKNL